MPPADPAFRLFPSPHPPTPFPAGRGRSRLFLCKGLPPLASPGLNPSGTGCPCRTGTLAGGLSGWLPARPATAVPNGSACRLCRLLTLPSLSFLPPSPKGKDSPPTRARRALFPTGRGRSRLFYARGFAPGTPALDRLRRLQSQQNRHSGGRRIPETALTVSAHPVWLFSGSSHEPRLLQSIHSRKVLGGLGDSFKSPPALLLPPCGESGGRRRSPCGAEKEGGYRDQEKRQPRGRRSRQDACGQTACRGTAPVSWARARRR